MFVRFYEAFLGFPKWFQFGLCPIAYVMVGLCVSLIFSWMQVKYASKGCGDFSKKSGWGHSCCPGTCLCASHQALYVIFQFGMILSLLAWPATLTIMAVFYTIAALIKYVINPFIRGLDWIWNIPDRASVAKWKDLARLVELIREKFEWVEITVQEVEKKKDVRVFHISGSRAIVVGGYSVGKGFIVKAKVDRNSTEPIELDEKCDQFLELQAAYHKIISMI